MIFLRSVLVSVDLTTGLVPGPDIGPDFKRLDSEKQA